MQGWGRKGEDRPTGTGRPAKPMASSCPPAGAQAPQTEDRARSRARGRQPHLLSRREGEEQGDREMTGCVCQARLEPRPPLRTPHLRSGKGLLGRRVRQVTSRHCRAQAWLVLWNVRQTHLPAPRLPSCPEPCGLGKHLPKFPGAPGHAAPGQEAHPEPLRGPPRGECPAEARSGLRSSLSPGRHPAHGNQRAGWAQGRAFPVAAWPGRAEERGPQSPRSVTSGPGGGRTEGAQTGSQLTLLPGATMESLPQSPHRRRYVLRINTSARNTPARTGEQASGTSSPRPPHTRQTLASDMETLQPRRERGGGVGCPASTPLEAGLAPSLPTTTLGIKWTSCRGPEATQRKDRHVRGEGRLQRRGGGGGGENWQLAERSSGPSATCIWWPGHVPGPLQGEGLGDAAFRRSLLSAPKGSPS